MNISKKNYGKIIIRNRVHILTLLTKACMFGVAGISGPYPPYIAVSITTNKERKANSDIQQDAIVSDCVNLAVHTLLIHDRCMVQSPL
jgi:hypothetical protein